MTVLLCTDVYRSCSIIVSSVFIGTILQKESQALVTILLGANVYRSCSIIVSSV